MFSAVIPWADRGPATYLPPAQLASHLVAAWEAETGRTLMRQVAELLLAQIILETKWSRSMWRFNWGNITAGNSWTGPVWRPSWFELTPDSSVRDQDLHEQMLAGKAPSAFRAYLSHQAGARDYVRILNNRFQAILAAAETGDPALFAEAVRTSRYCPDCGAGFEQSVRAIQAQIQTAGWFSGLPLPSMLVASKRSIFAVAAGAVVLAGAAAWGALAFLRGSR